MAKFLTIAEMAQAEIDRIGEEVARKAKPRHDLEDRLIEVRRIIAALDRYCRIQLDELADEKLDDDEMKACHGIIAGDMDLDNLAEIFPDE